MWKGAGRKEQVNKKSGEWGERGLRVSEKQPSPAQPIIWGRGKGICLKGGWRVIPAGGSQHGWTRTRAYEWALTRPSTALLGASHWISHNLAVRFQGARRLLDKRTAHSPPQCDGAAPWLTSRSVFTV